MRSVTSSVTPHSSVTGVTPPGGTGGAYTRAFHRDTLTARARRYATFDQANVGVTGVSRVATDRVVMGLDRVR